MRSLSIVIPAYDEEAYIAAVLQRVLAVPTEERGFAKQVIVVDDASKDRTAEIARGFAGVTVLQQTQNQGKGAAVARGVRESTGDFILIQDADMEYEPADYLPMIEALGSDDRVAVYGSRPLGGLRRYGWMRATPGRWENQGIGPWAMNWLLFGMTLVLFGVAITDMLTAYKLYPGEMLRRFRIRTRGFETDHELSAKLIRSGVKIREVPIDYRPRSVEEGKKIRALDGVKAILTLFRFRFCHGEDLLR